MQQCGFQKIPFTLVRPNEPDQPDPTQPEFWVQKRVQPEKKWVGYGRTVLHLIVSLPYFTNFLDSTSMKS